MGYNKKRSARIGVGTLLNETVNYIIDQVKEEFMVARFKGGCACGAIRYECTAEPAFVANCHCKDCQKATGGQMATVAAVPKSAWRIVSGKTKSFAYAGDSGNKIYRHFCETCGSRLFSDAKVMPDMIFVTAGSMDDASWLKPSMHIYTDSAQPWAYIPPEAKRYPKMPT